MLLTDAEIIAALRAWPDLSENGLAKLSKRARQQMQEEDTRDYEFWWSFMQKDWQLISIRIWLRSFRKTNNITRVCTTSFIRSLFEHETNMGEYLSRRTVITAVLAEGFMIQPFSLGGHAYMNVERRMFADTKAELERARFIVEHQKAVWMTERETKIRANRIDALMPNMTDTSLL